MTFVMRKKVNPETLLVSDLQATYERSGTTYIKGLQSLLSGSPSDPIAAIRFVRKGIEYHDFLKVSTVIPLSIKEWSGILSVSERTMQRYEKENKNFDPPQTEKILQVALFYNKAAGVFGDPEKLRAWLEAPSVALGGNKPKDLLDSGMGIQLLNDELDRIEHGIFA